MKKAIKNFSIITKWLFSSDHKKINMTQMNLKKSIFVSGAFMMVAAMAIFTLSCNKKFDEPPGYIAPNVTVTMTIADLRAMHSSGNVESLSNPDIIEGVVVANDSSGNFYKQIAIEDASGGLAILINDYSLYTSFPIGRKIYISVNGLTLGDYNGLVQLGGGSDGTGAQTGIAANLVDTYIIKGDYNQPITPTVVTSLSDLNDSYQSRLIQLDGFEFDVNDTAKTYADAAKKLSVNYPIKNCAGQSIILRTSGYAGFAADGLPNGNGTLYAIYSVFGSTKQLIVRDPSDVQFFGDRCTGGGGGGGGSVGNATIIDISDLRALYSGNGVLAPSNRKISGIVISDRATKNINGNNLVLQQGDGLAGIVVRFTSPHSYNLGDKIEVNITGDSITKYKEWMQVNYAKLDSSVKTGTGTITPRVTTISNALANFSNWESTLIQLNTVTISGTGTTWSGSKTITDATGSLPCYTQTGATFSGSIFPASSNTFTGYLSTFTSPQITIRSTNDVQ